MQVTVTAPVVGNDPPSSDSGGGGGSFEWLTLAALFGYLTHLAWRRQRLGLQLRVRN